MIQFSGSEVVSFPFRVGVSHVTDAMFTWCIEYDSVAGAMFLFTWNQLFPIVDGEPAIVFYFTHEVPAMMFSLKFT